MLGVVMTVMFGGAVLNIIYHGNIPEVMIPGFRIMCGLAILGVLIFTLALGIDHYLVKKTIANRRIKRSKLETVLSEKYAKEHAFSVRWSRIFQTILHTQP